MNTNISFPSDFYEKLYEEIMNTEFTPESEDDTTCPMEIEIGHFFVSVNARFDVEEVDDSFDHEFGTHYDSHIEVGDLEDINVNNVYFFDHDANIEEDVTNMFDEVKFWAQFKKYGNTINGIDIHYGDEVVVKQSMSGGVWEKMIYLYTDIRLGKHVCTRSLHTKYIIKRDYGQLLPATTAYLSLVGSPFYYLKLRV